MKPEFIDIFANSDDMLPVPTKSEDKSIAVGIAEYADEKVMTEFERRIEELNYYAAKAENPHDIYDETLRLKLFAELSYGLRKAGEAYAWAQVQYKLAVIKRKEAEAVASIDEFGDWLKTKKNDDDKTKATETVRKNFVYMSPNVRVAYRQEAIVEGMVEQLGVLRQEFGQAIATLRAMCFGYRDSSQMSGSSSHVGNND